MVGLKYAAISVRLIELAIKYAKALGGEIILVHCLEKDAENDFQKIRNAENFLEDMTVNVIDREVECVSYLLIRGNDPGEELVHFANEKNADSIIIGVKDRSKAGKIVFGSTAQYIILNAHCSVITLNIDR